MSAEQSLSGSGLQAAHTLVGMENYGGAFLYTLSVSTRTSKGGFASHTGLRHWSLAWPCLYQTTHTHTRLYSLPTAWHIVGIQAAFGGGREGEREPKNLCSRTLTHQGLLLCIRAHFYFLETSI